MKRTCLTLWFLSALLLVCLRSMADREPLCVGTEVSIEQASHSKRCDGHTATGGVNDGSDRRLPAAATVGSARDAHRICNTRPQRLLPSQGANHQRPTGKTPTTLSALHSHRKRSVYNEGCRIEAAPFRPAVSRDYYIIALRRIIR